MTEPDFRRGPSYLNYSSSWTSNPGSSYTGCQRQYLCPDLLSIRNIGAADGWRGQVVRVFFRLLKWVTGA